MKKSKIYEVYGKATAIVNSNLSWETKYSLIFSKSISGKVSFDWYDPDCDYEDDVRAFMNGFDAYMAGLALSNLVKKYIEQ